MTTKRDRISPYGVIKQTQILRRLTPAEQEEYEYLDALPDRTEIEEERMGDLWERALVRHQARPDYTAENDLYLYAAEIARRMGSR